LPCPFNEKKYIFSFLSLAAVKWKAAVTAWGLAQAAPGARYFFNNNGKFTYKGKVFLKDSATI
jgi:hypothetical protein